MIGAAALAALPAVAAGVRVAVGRLRAPELPPGEGPSAEVTVLLPVRDEEDDIEPCLAGVLAQPDVVRALVLDDGSRDRTAERVAAIAEIDRRVVLRRVPAPPVGESGKIHALAYGARVIASDWILAVDADVRLATGSLARALAAVRSHGLAAISLAARQRTRTLGEALLTPLVFGLLDFELGDWRAAAQGAGVPVANGQFFLVQRRALEAAGGYPAIAGQPLDDVALARNLAATGTRVGFWRGDEALEVRMYKGLRGSFLGWRRNLALLFGRRPRFAAAVASLSMLPALSAVGWLLSGDVFAALAAWCGGVLASALLRAGTGSSALWALTYPFDAAVLSACLVTAVGDRTRGRVAPWRGRTLAPPASADRPQSRAESGAA